ncbi:MAG: hypothetical protein P1P90_02120 [Patescibacteria group bacterium]|nr:hypothetical protein [Patescibacteria group bacterium]
MPVTTFDLLQHIQIAGILHANCPKKSGNTNRIWDGKTPYIFHPLWCASTIVTEQLLGEGVRKRGALTLIYHDVIEDTLGSLPSNLPRDVITAIQQMTFESQLSTWENIRRRDPEIRLFKLYDKTANLLDPLELRAFDLQDQRILVQVLIEDVKENYGNLNIVKIASSLAAV